MLFLALSIYLNTCLAFIDFAAEELFTTKKMHLIEGCDWRVKKCHATLPACMELLKCYAKCPDKTSGKVPCAMRCEELYDTTNLAKVDYKLFCCVHGCEKEPVISTGPRNTLTTLDMSALEGVWYITRGSTMPYCADCQMMNVTKTAEKEVVHMEWEYKVKKDENCTYPCEHLKTRSFGAEVTQDTTVQGNIHGLDVNWYKRHVILYEPNRFMLMSYSDSFILYTRSPSYDTSIHGHDELAIRHAIHEALGNLYWQEKSSEKKKWDLNYMCHSEQRGC